MGYKARYGKLLREDNGLFTRSAGGDRVVETGKYWLQVFIHSRLTCLG
jgi:hypothetical protein